MSLFEIRCKNTNLFANTDQTVAFFSKKPSVFDPIHLRLLVLAGLLHKCLEVGDGFVVGHEVGGVLVVVETLDDGGLRMVLQGDSEGLVGALHGLDDVDAVGGQHAGDTQRGTLDAAGGLVVPRRRSMDDCVIALMR